MPGLCPRCRAFNLEDKLAPAEILGIVGEKGIEFSDIIFPRDLSCTFCQFVLRCLSASGATTVTLRFQHHGWARTVDHAISHSVVMMVQHRGQTRARVMPFWQNAGCVGGTGPGYAKYVQPDRADLGLAHTWVQECIQKHLPCQRLVKQISNTLKPLPIRLLDIRDMCVIQTTLGAHEYCALSYVWGKASQLKLSHKNLEQLSMAGSLRSKDTLPSAVIQDAIKVTIQIGYHFLWVDTLCICQDDLQEPELQVLAMNQVFKGAVLTIIAADAHDSSAGLTGVEKYKEPRIHSKGKVWGMNLLTVYPSLHEVMPESIWSTRGWTFQEEEFSRRCLYFTKHQIYFRCFQSTFSEDICELSPEPDVRKLANIFFDHRGVALKNWQGYVQDFTARNLTLDVDRLNAFQGMLVELEEHHHYPSLFGIPRYDFPNCLAWFQQDSVGRRIPMYPSWSWCGWTHPVNFVHHGGLRHFRACLVSIYCPSMSTGPIWQSNSIKSPDTKTELSLSPGSDESSSELENSALALDAKLKEKFWFVIRFLFSKIKPKDKHNHNPRDLSLLLHSLAFFIHDKDLDLYKALISSQRPTYSHPITNLSGKLFKTHLVFSAFVLTTRVRIFPHYESLWQLQGRPIQLKKKLPESAAMIRFNHIMEAELMLSPNHTTMTFVLIYTHNPGHTSLYDNAIMLIVRKQNAGHYERVGIAEMSEQTFIQLKPQIERVFLG